MNRLKALLRDRSGVTAVIVAVTLPALLVGVGLAVESSLIQVRSSQLQAVADASAGAARDVYKTEQSGRQGIAVEEAHRIANNNNAGNLITDADVVNGWWDITKTGTTDKFGPPTTSQTGLPFSNAIRVTTRLEHPIAFGALLGRDHISLKSQSTAYKCSNTDYPLTLIRDDVPSPSLPALWMSWATPGHGPDTSYYYEQPDGTRNPIFKFYSPYDGQDVSFVLILSNSHSLQVDTYCAGTYLVSPAEFDTRSKYFHNDDGSPVTVTGYVLRGSTNNSFDTYSDQTQYPFAFQPTPYYTSNEILTPQYDLEKVHTTQYPSYNGNHSWASQGSPTPDRRALLVR